MNVNKSVLPIAALLAALGVIQTPAYAIGADAIINSANRNIGDDKIPCRITKLQRPANALPGGYVDLNAWVYNNYGSDKSMPIHLISGTERTISVKGLSAMLYKTLERDSIYQNLLIDDGKTLTLYQTPHDTQINPDGNSVFPALLGVTVPYAHDTALEANSYIESLQEHSFTNDDAHQ